MARCDQCGKDDDGSFELWARGQIYTFHSFACAAEALAMKCAHCGSCIVGYGVERGSAIFCTAHCAEHTGVLALPLPTKGLNGTAARSVAQFIRDGGSI